MSFGTWVAALALLSYLAGAIPFTLLLGKLKGVDVRKVGSGNVGAMNLGRLLGRRWFFYAFGSDLAKGFLPSLVAGWALSDAVTPDGPSMVGRQLWRLGIGALAVVGHNYPIYIGFRGGKGVSTSLGVALGVYPEFTVPGVLSFLCWAGGLGITRMSSVGSLAGAILFPVFVAGWSIWRGERLADRWPFLGFAILTAVMVVVRHRANIARIIAGTETKVGGGAAAGGIAPG